MPRFFVPDEDMSGDTISIRGDDARHIARSLRMAVGDGITVCDFAGREYDCKLTSISDGCVIAEVLSSSASEAEPPYRATLYQALPKGDKMDIIAQKAVECGVTEIVPFISERCISRPDRSAIEKKTERWNKIAREAAMQCGRGIIPTVRQVVTFDSIVSDSDRGGLKLFFYEGDGTLPLPDILKGLPDKPKEISFIIGGEGGFSVEESERAASAGYIPAGLGKRILRCETAAVFALACISYEFEQG